jgi:hypothetical protein
MAVPARTRGVWHLEGDPFEAWLESRTDEELAELASASSSALAAAPASAAAIAHALALASSTFAADTTRTPWGRLHHRVTRRGTVLDPSTIEAQARALLPRAVNATEQLLALHGTWSSTR